MTWVKGLTTWGALEHDLTSLIVGDKADDSATTVASGDRWVREVTRTVTDGVLNSTTTVTSATASFVASDVGSLVIGTGIPTGTTISSVTNATTVVLSAAATASASGVTLQVCTNTIRTPAAKDVATGNISNRSGYFANMGVGSSIQAAFPASAVAGMSTVAKVVNPYTSDPSSSGFHRWILLLVVSTANTVPGNYSTGLVQYYGWDADSGTIIWGGTAVAPNAAGNVTITNGLQVNISDPSGTLTVQTKFARGFTSAYMYGIDYWPMLYRASSAPSFSVAPAGVNGTDYDIVKLPSPPQNLGGQVIDRGGLFHGLGIKTATGLGASALYTVSFPMALAKTRIFSSGTAGLLSLDVGGSAKDAVNSLSTFRCLGIRVTNWLKMFQTAGSVTTSSQVQYWMSVTADGVAIALYGDPGSTGKIGTAWIGAGTPIDPTYDVFPISYNVSIQDYSTDAVGENMIVGTQYSYWALRRRQDGSEGSRDWQTKWMRADGLMCYAAYAGAYYIDTSSTSYYALTPATASAAQALQPIGVASTIGGANTNGVPARQNKPAPDGKWWLYGAQYAEGTWGGINAGTTDEARFPRWTQNTRWVFIPDIGWASGDELTDSVSGTKYFLIQPDYAGLGSRIRTNTNTFFGGLAIAEI